MVNEYTVNYHPSPSEVTTRIHPLIFQWTPEGFIFSPEYFLNLFKPVFRTTVAEKLQIHGVKIAENACVSQKFESVHFYLCP